jgi:formylglycine-generating enzyme required for sulfatase activity
MGKFRVRTGLPFDLPTAGQWEYACRAGTTSDYNNGGNSEDDLKQLARYRYNSSAGGQSDGKGGFSQHTTVGSYLPNAWGLYDMHGNAWEWCLDWRGGLSGGVTDPRGPSSGEERVHRGGGWFWYPGDCTSSHLWGNAPSYSYNESGLRLAMTLTQ